MSLFPPSFVKTGHKLGPSCGVPSSGQVWFIKVLSLSFQKTLKSRFERQPQQHFQFCLNILSCLVRIKLHTKISPPSLLNVGDRSEEELKICIWKTTLTTFLVFQNISSILVRIKLHTKNQPPILLNFGYRYQDDLKIRIRKTTSTTYPDFSQYFF